MPSIFREELGRSERPDLLWALPNPNNNGDWLTLYTDEHWRELTEAIEAAANDTEDRNRVLLALADEGRRLSLDKAGRVLISPEQRSAAGLNREVMILGLGSKIQVWDKLAYERQAPQNKEVLRDYYKKGLKF